VTSYTISSDSQLLKLYRQSGIIMKNAAETRYTDTMLRRVTECKTGS